ncbi:membrane protein insertase YidC [uncultured Sphaerochaeta sp.]|uniref:membrane protein insertase YidC n=1 Tax=uncultured Sphaerochaeta sp. TaxID=886478 RepID=UPI0029CA292A|nr:membrane protein insertase YidC [uncultured Sphaerochaeta sp.]
MQPIELLIELLFVFFYKAFDNYGFAIAGISLFVGFLTLPLYRVADQLQRKERDMRVAMQPGIQRIKTAFKGDEQYMILSTFYRQNHYHPAYALRSSVSLLIQVPFFIAAYHFLSHLPQLQGESFLFIQDLGRPDGLLSIGSFSINVLPILMTVVNVAAGIIYTKGFPLRDKLQLYGMAGLFLVLLYNSPAGLVFYWTLNNVFSLIKNIFYKLKQPLKVLYILAVIGAVGMVSAILLIKSDFPLIKRLVLLFGVVIIIALPLLIKAVQLFQARYLARFMENKKQVALLFILSMVMMWLISSFVIPANLIATSPIEFSFTGVVQNPLFYVYQTALLFFGFFVIWPIFIYGMASKEMRSLFAFLALVFSLSAVVNVFVFPGAYGNVSKVLLFDEPALLRASTLQTIIPLLVTLAIFIVITLLFRGIRLRILTSLLTITVLASAANGIYTMINIQKAYAIHAKNVEGNSLTEIQSDRMKPVIQLNKEGKNVVVLFLDRAISSYLPIIFNQFPELEEQYTGFTFYPNTVSPGKVTLTGSPPIMGGYEYLPSAINLREDEKLVDKHNEASLVLPLLFSETGYDVSVFDPPLANYQWESDFSAFKTFPDVHVSSLKGRYSSQYKMEHPEIDLWGPEYESNLITRRMPMFSLLRIAYPILRQLFYYEGTYFLMDENTQNTNSFIDSYSVLHYLPRLTSTVTEKNSFIFMVNDTTHEPIFLQAPEYEPVVDVTDIRNPLQEDEFYDEKAQIHYHANVAALRKIGIWLDYLREEAVFNNTRIIIVSDHGNTVATPAFRDFTENGLLLASYNALLMVKDFESTKPMQTDNSFMTTADVPILALDQIREPAINPFTGKDVFEVVDKSLIECYYSSHDPQNNRGNKFDYNAQYSFSIHDSIFEESNWTPLGQE